MLALFEQIRQEAPLQVNSEQAVAYASDCTGWGSCSQSFHHLHVASEPQFMCELNAKLRQMLATSFAPLRMHTDVWSASRRKESLAQPVVVYEAGFPCQPFAPQGKHQGLDDERGRGQVIHAILDYLSKANPAIFVLENVQALVQDKHRDTFKEIMHALRTIRQSAADMDSEPFYTVRAKVLDTLDHGLPQSRKRLYIVGISSAMLRCSGDPFTWPRRRRVALPLECFYDTRPRRQCHETVTSQTFRRNIDQTYRFFRSEGIDPDSRHFILNIGNVPSESGPCHFTEGKVPCLTATRCAIRALYSSWLKRRLTITELARLQGCSSASEITKDMLGNLSKHQAGKAIGNAMSAPVLALVLRQALLAAGVAVWHDLVP